MYRTNLIVICNVATIYCAHARSCDTRDNAVNTISEGMFHYSWPLLQVMRLVCVQGLSIGARALSSSAVRVLLQWHKRVQFMICFVCVCVAYCETADWWQVCGLSN